MNISGLQKLSLVDFDKHMCATIFTNGCNFACPYCHNSSLVINPKNLLNEYEVLSFLQKRKSLLDSVCVSGGEPTLNKDLPEFISKLKNMGYIVKLDTNGSNFNMLKYLIDNKLIDYVAMDIKNCMEKYQETANASVNLDNIQSSIKYIKKSGIDYEFRTTLIKEYHTNNDIEKISILIKGAKRYFLQKFVNSETCISNNLNEIDKNTALKFQEILIKNIPNTKLRGY